MLFVWMHCVSIISPINTFPFMPLCTFYLFIYLPEVLLGRLDSGDLCVKTHRSLPPLRLHRPPPSDRCSAPSLIVFKYLFLFIAKTSGEVRCHGGHHLHGQKQPHLLGAGSAFDLRAETRRLRGAPKCLSLTRGCRRPSVIHTIDERIWTKMGNKQTIFTDEQLDAYQVRFASSTLSRARQRIILKLGE